MTRAKIKPTASDPIDLACRLNDEAVSCYNEGQNKKAERLFRRAISLLEEAEGPDSPDVANVINSLAGHP